MTFSEVIETLRDGKAYRFTCPGLAGYFYKAPYPSDPDQTALDGAYSAITFWNGDYRASPTLMLYDFDDNCWEVQIATKHPQLD